MARPERFELPTAWFVARYSIQLSYGRKLRKHLPFTDDPQRGANYTGQRLDEKDCFRPWGRRNNWRRERDLNPRYAFGVYTLIRGAPSTTRPSLQYLPEIFCSLFLRRDRLFGPSLDLALAGRRCYPTLFRIPCRIPPTSSAISPCKRQCACKDTLCVQMA